jgi:sec-independent protein translocase protein TatA
MGNLGFQELLIIGIVILVMFGGRKIPEFMRGLGKGIREFNDAKNNVKKEIEEGIKEKDDKASKSTIYCFADNTCYQMPWSIIYLSNDLCTCIHVFL